MDRLQASHLIQDLHEDLTLIQKNFAAIGLCKGAISPKLVTLCQQLNNIEQSYHGISAFLKLEHVNLESIKYMITPLQFEVIGRWPVSLNALLTTLIQEKLTLSLEDWERIAHLPFNPDSDYSSPHWGECLVQVIQKCKDCNRLTQHSISNLLTYAPTFVEVFDQNPLLHLSPNAFKRLLDHLDSREQHNDQIRTDSNAALLANVDTNSTNNDQAALDPADELIDAFIGLRVAHCANDYKQAFKMN